MVPTRNIDEDIPARLEKRPPAVLSASRYRKGETMIAVIFESWPSPGRAQTYLDMAASLRSDLEKQDGFISIERFQSITDPGKLLALSFWRDEAAVAAWRNLEVHRNVQASSRKSVFRDYRLRIAAVVRDYGMTNREQAPADSRMAHE